MDNNNEKEFLKKVEDAAKKGVKAGIKNNLINSEIIKTAVLVLCGIIAFNLITNKINSINDKIDENIKSFFIFENDADEHDLVLDDDGILGYTAADFENAILSEGKHQSKIIVYSLEASETATIIDTGFIDWSIFTKEQAITYIGEVNYSVDLSTIKKGDIRINEDKCTITLLIPHSKMEKINIPEDKMLFGSVDKGFFAFGSIKLTPEQLIEVQNGARKQMEAKLIEDNIQELADRMAVLTIWELYSPIVKSIAPNYSIEVVMK